MIKPRTKTPGKPEKAWFGWFRSVGGRIAPALILDFLTADERAKAVALVDLPLDLAALPLADLAARYPLTGEPKTYA